MVTHKVQMARF